MKTCNVSENLEERQLEYKGQLVRMGGDTEEEKGVGRQVGEILCYSYHAFTCIP
jgi:hypothetical protein